MSTICNFSTRYTTLGKLRDTYWSENQPSKSVDFGPVSQSSDMLNYGYSQPKTPKAGYNDLAELQQPKKANFNDSYEDSVFLSNNSWSGKSVQENGDMTDHPGTTSREWYPPPHDNSYPRSSSVHSSSVHGNSQHYDRASSAGHLPVGSGNYGRSNPSSGQQQHYDRLNSNSSSGNYERGTNSAHSNGPHGGDHGNSLGPPFDRTNSSGNYDRTSSLGHSPAGYDSLRRRKGELYSSGQQPAEGLYSSGKPPSVRGSGEQYVDFVVTLMRQESGFGFRIVGGTEEGSQVSGAEDFYP